MRTKKKRRKCSKHFSRSNTTILLAITSLSLSISSLFHCNNPVRRLTHPSATSSSSFFFFSFLSLFRPPFTCAVLCSFSDSCVLLLLFALHLYSHSVFFTTIILFLSSLLSPSSATLPLFTFPHPLKLLTNTLCSCFCRTGPAVVILANELSVLGQMNDCSLSFLHRKKHFNEK